MSMRRDRSNLTKLTTTSVVLAAGFGLLVMHALSIPDAGEEMRSHPQQTATMPASIASTHTRVDVARPEMRGHEHQLLGCIWLLVAGLTLVIAHVLTRLRGSRRDPVAVLRNALSTTQRAPPVSARLSLVGVSRR